MRAVVLSLLAITTSVPAVGDACDCAPLRPQILIPLDGSSEVPVNTKVFVSADVLGLDLWRGLDATAKPPKIVISEGRGGKKVGKGVKVRISSMVGEGVGTIFVVTPERPLAPKKGYVLALDGKAYARFQTGSGSDGTAPAFAGIENFTAVLSHRSAQGPCDDGPPFRQLSWRAGPAEDASAAAGLLRILYVQRQGEPRTIRLVESPPAGAGGEASVQGSICDRFRIKFAAGDVLCASIEVVDAAGNVAGASAEKCMPARKM